MMDLRNSTSKASSDPKFFPPKELTMIPTSSAAIATALNRKILTDINFKHFRHRLVLANSAIAAGKQPTSSSSSALSPDSPLLTTSPQLSPLAALQSPSGQESQDVAHEPASDRVEDRNLECDAHQRRDFLTAFCDQRMGFSSSSCQSTSLMRNQRRDFSSTLSRSNTFPDQRREFSSTSARSAASNDLRRDFSSTSAPSTSFCDERRDSSSTFCDQRPNFSSTSSPSTSLYGQRRDFPTTLCNQRKNFSSTSSRSTTLRELFESEFRQENRIIDQFLDNEFEERSNLLSRSLSGFSSASEGKATVGDEVRRSDMAEAGSSESQTHFKQMLLFSKCKSTIQDLQSTCKASLSSLILNVKKRASSSKSCKRTNQYLPSPDDEATAFQLDSMRQGITKSWALRFCKRRHSQAPESASVFSRQMSNTSSVHEHYYLSRRNYGSRLRKRTSLPYREQLINLFGCVR